MVRRWATLLLLSLSTLHCVPQNINRDNSTSASGSWRCSLDGFTAEIGESSLVEIENPFVVRQVEGRVINKGDRKGEWVKQAPVLFEIKSTGKEQKITKTYADEQGNFAIKDVPERRYCFKATNSGFQSIIGNIIVRRRADPAKRIVFEMGAAL